ncbi:putative late blight resistance protein homolog R1A-3, partial [Solanum tuberosum]
MAYAAVTSLMRTIHQSMELNGCDLQPFYEKLESLRAILEKSCNITGDHEGLTTLEVEITEVAFKAEDMVDSKSRKVSSAETVITRSKAFWELCCSLEQEVECIDSFMMQWLAIWDWYNNIKDFKAQNFCLSKIPELAVERSEVIMVGYENEFKMMLDQLARGERELEVVSIVGMGGIGKTTLATKLYNDPCMMYRFDIRAKATVSQEYCVRNVFLDLLSCISDKPYDQLHDGQLADRLQKLLKGKRYLVVIDDIWTTKAWDDIQICFPDFHNGSRILLTTRNVEVAEYASSGKLPHHMRLMNFDESWNLLYEKVFTKDSFSPEYEQLGKQIALKCGGLPLAIVVIAGLLTKIDKALSEWQSVAENVSSAVSTDVGVQCMRVLAMSYHYLPHHLKPCFLYFAIFPEDKLIFVNKLMILWETEGFLKVEEMKSIEEVAEKYLQDLIDRSLISIKSTTFDGKIKCCGIHDMTRELCLMEARNMNFVNVLRRKNDQNSYVKSMQCLSKSRSRISIHNKKEYVRCLNSEAHSVILFGRFRCCMREYLPFKLVRVLDLADNICLTFPREILYLIHLRHLALRIYPNVEQYLGSEEDVLSSRVDIPTSISNLCYLQSLVLYLPLVINLRKHALILPSDILTMPQLRHLHLDRNYLRYHELTEKSLVMKNLHSLFGWNPSYCTASFFRLFPNLKELQVRGIPQDFHSHKDLYDFRYLDHLEELAFCLPPQNNAYFLERRMCFQTRNPLVVEVVPSLILPPPDAFPRNLKNLTFTGNFFLSWKDLSIVVGKLPKLELLELTQGVCRGREWEVAEEGFPFLKFLLLKRSHIQYWRASCDHFPCLERLFLDSCRFLDSIPQDFADITTLALIYIRNCPESVGNSAKQIQQDIQDNYGGSIEVHIHQAFEETSDDDDHDDDDD